ncbi:DeoR/GlpR family DNA-binding transcription regulator [Aliiroseovarius sp. KMU-50]|uniref:DeoR/GlpR family DNA-binding transcription regulator n=1 Tax=Aliiroseovarius salicola TaxID=3009082 RepID=A0ABT4W0U1_9RHOB|nr:DeoR/GlpR family DNA-binding transcription regulator [Aliiroseovarius sp. KMU-50]MDA5094133.1 DeoR/GlpR family DNA-binding transcription regulator [Aliiroseovarius sp. KMU-50]
MEPRANHRQKVILDELRRSGGSMRIHALAQALDVTEETVRRNLKSLADEGLVDRMHGGVRIVESDAEADFNARYRDNPVAKQKIASHVARMLPNDVSLFLDIGSTTAHIADALRDHQRLVVVTNSVYVAFRLATRNGNRVFLAGGELRGHDGGAFGTDAMEFVANFNTDFAVLSSAGITSKGFFLFDLEEARFSRLIMQQADTRIMAADSSKFGGVAPVDIGRPSQVDYLICDREPPQDIASAAMADWGTKIQIAK